MTLVRHYDTATAPRGIWRGLQQLPGYPSLIWRNRYMVQNFLRRDLMGRFHGSFLGVYWLLLQPLFQFAIYYLVFGYLFGNVRAGEAPDPKTAIHIFSGVIVFYSLVEATTQCCGIVVENGNLVKKVAFPSEVMVVHVGLVSIVLYLVGAAVCMILGLSFGVMHPGLLLLALPLVLLVQLVFTIGLGLLLSSINVFIRDTTQLWRTITMAWMFVTPVFWPESYLTGKLPPDSWVPAAIFHSNPAYPLLQAHRFALGADHDIAGDFWTHLGIASLWAVFFLVVGYSTFMSRKHKFADLI